MTDILEQRSPVGVLGFGVAACAACCAGPLFAFLGGATAAGLAGTVFVGAVGVVVVVVAAVAYVAVRRRQQRSACAIGAESVPVTISARPVSPAQVETEGVR
jgi:mercuric ion transport protein